MKILVTNDDGFLSEGIQVLSSVLRSRHDVWVVAPASNRSGVSHGITMNDPLRIRMEGSKVFSCSGLPADCALTGMNAIMDGKPDVVISGINRGANLGTDILFSGTAAAARQAALTGIPGIAVSLVSSGEDFLWEPLARFVLENLSDLVSLCERDVFVNINAASLSAYRGARITGVSRRTYNDSIELRDAPDGTAYSFFMGGAIETEGDGMSDWAAVEDGFVSVSRVCAQPMDKRDTRFDDVRFRV